MSLQKDFKRVNQLIQLMPIVPNLDDWRVEFLRNITLKKKK